MLVPPKPGFVVAGRYLLLRHIGTGGMGSVWAGRDVVLLRDVALKEVAPQASLSDTERATLHDRTLCEARAAGRIRTDAAVAVHDVVEEHGRTWIVMEMLSTGSLEDLLRMDGKLPPHRVAEIGLRLLRALDSAHRVGVLHRDVKPANVLFDAAGQAVLTDFGIASLEGSSSLGTTGPIVGSPAFLAPERARGEAPTPASDLWSLGVTLYAAVEGRSPFERSGEPIATLVAILDNEVPPIDSPLWPAIEGLLRKEPQERIDATAARRMLEAVAAQGPATEAEPPSSWAEIVAPAAQSERPARQTQSMDLAEIPPSAGLGSNRRSSGSGRHSKHRRPRARSVIVAAVLAGCALAGTGAAMWGGYNGSAAEPGLEPRPTPRAGAPSR